MNKHSGIVIPILVVVAAALLIFIFDREDPGEGAPFLTASTNTRGASLFYDTLAHMGYHVNTIRRPITMNTNTDYVHVIIQPIHFYQQDGEYLIQWVETGGQLVFLHNGMGNALSRQIPGTAVERNGLRFYQVGEGTIVTGRANDITNRTLVNNPQHGTQLHQAITSMNPTSIVFVEYYHHPRASENFFNTLPLIVRIIFVQLALVAALGVWHMGKRFGNPVAYYGAHEREENEHVHALARLYWKSGSKKRRKKHDS